jgi:integrase/recombinase XerD
MQDAFHAYLLGEGMAPNTIRAYLYRLGHFLRWCDEEGLDPATIEPPDLARYLEGVPTSNSWRRHLRSVLKHWWRFVGREHPPLRAIRVPPKPRMVCKAVTDEQAGLLVKVARGWYPQGTAVLMGMYLALRREEIAKARWDRFDQPMEWYTVQGKGSVTATLPVHPVLEEELRTIPHGESPYLFPGDPDRKRAHVHPATIWDWSKQVGEAAGLGAIPPHILRHTALATANDRLGDLRAVMVFARHTRPDVTASYTRTTSERLRQVVEALEYTDFL